MVANSLVSVDPLAKSQGLMSNPIVRSRQAAIGNDVLTIFMMCYNSNAHGSVTIWGAQKKDISADQACEGAHVDSPAC